MDVDLEFGLLARLRLWGRGSVPLLRQGGSWEVSLTSVEIRARKTNAFLLSLVIIVVERERESQMGGDEAWRSFDETGQCYWNLRGCRSRETIASLRSRESRPFGLNSKSFVIS